MEIPRQRAIRITPAVKKEIAATVDERIREAYVTKEDFSALKVIVKELAEAEKELAEAESELARAQKELAEAEKKTEEAVQRLAIEVNDLRIGQENLRIGLEDLRIGQENLRIGQENLRREVGGLVRSLDCAFENEAYRMLPKTLKERYGVELKERLIRKVIDDTEINILGIGMRDGREVVVVGEAKVRLEDIGVFDKLEEKIEVVSRRYSGKEVEVVGVLATHIASGRVLKEAEERGVIVIQSFEWEV